MRVPAALCGTFALKPTYGRVSRAGTQLFSSSLDHVGPFARSVGDIARAYDILQGPDPRDPVCSGKPAEAVTPQLEDDCADLRLAKAVGFFAENIAQEVASMLDIVTHALGVEREVEIPEVHRVAPASFIITGVEASNLHLDSVRNRQADFDPMTRDRFIAGALLPANWYAQAQRFRRWFRDQIAEIFENIDVLVLPATPCTAPLIGAPTVTIDGIEYPKRPVLSRLVQPFSFIGWPTLVVPLAAPGPLPIGVQLVGRPFEEATLLRVGRALEKLGIARAWTDH
jgi:Asp-tRNA(Asn)/Glu-tRNA(Gln) amidotransferase A subunit family amidase